MRVGKANATTTLIATGMSEAPRSGKAACRLDAARAGVASARAVRGATVGRVTSASGPRFSAMGRADGAGTGCGARAVRRRRWDGKIRALCMIRGVSATKRAPPWQDLRAVYSRKAICRTFRMHGAHILPKPARFGCMAAICCQEGALFLPEATFGMHEARELPWMAAQERIAAKYCRRQSLENAFRKDLAMDECPDPPRGE